MYDGGKLLSLKEVKDRLSISMWMLRQHVREGSISYVVLNKGQKRKRIRFTEDQLRNFVRRREERGQVRTSLARPPRR